MKLLNLEEMTIEQKLGMTYCARPGCPEDWDFIFEQIKKRAIGCIQVSFKRPDRVKQILETADYPIIIVCDTEGGFPGSDLPRAPLLALGACDDERYYEAFAKGVVRDAKKIGFNACWSPVVDILRCNERCKVSRVISDDPERVARGAEVISRVFLRNGYLSGAKHYPGGHNTPYDNHMAATVSSVTEQELLDFDLIPYKRLMEKGLLPAIMTSHCVFGNIDPDVPGTLSPKVQSIIRKIGFNGITFTDSFAMMAILQKYGEENILGMAIAAGNDIVLPNYRTPDRDAFAMLVKNYEDGMFTEERLNEAVSRVRAAHAFIVAEPEAPDTFTDDDLALLLELGEKCVTAICDEDVTAALDPYKKHLFVVLTDNEFEPSETDMEIQSDVWYSPNNITLYIKKYFPESTIMYLPEFPDKNDNEPILLAAAEHDDVIFTTFCSVAPYRGTDCLTRRVENMIDCVNLNKKLAAVVHFGNPNALQPLLHVKRKIFGYHMPSAQPHCYAALAGKMVPTGSLPLQIDFQ